MSAPQDPYEAARVEKLRHIEQLTPAETAQVLGIKEKAGGMRYVRAIRRLKDLLTSLPGGLSEPGP